MSAAAGERTRSSRTATTVALVTAALLICAFPTSAGAAEATGNTTLVVAKGKAKLLKKRAIGLRGIGGAVTEGRRTRLQVGGGVVGADGARLTNKGALRLISGKGRKRRVVRLTQLRTVLGPRSLLLGKLNGRGKRRVLFRLRAHPSRLALDGLQGTASLRRARLIWNRGAVRAVSRRLRAAVPRGTLGIARVGAVATGTEVPASGPISGEPPRLARPASAVDVTGATITWHVRSSWIGYLQTESPKSRAEETEGAIPGPAVVESEHPCLDDAGGESKPLVYDYTFPFTEGWYDDATGTAALYARGGLRSLYPGHGIDFTLREPEIEINGGTSRVISRVAGSGDTAYSNTRAAMLDLTLPGSVTESAPNSFGFADPIRGRLTADGLSVFGTYYESNPGFGCFSVSFSTG